MVETTLDKEFLIKLIQNNTSWSESLLRGLKEESLQEIYEYIETGVVIGKAKLTMNEQRYQVVFRIPKQIAMELNVSYGDWFGIKLNIDTQEVAFDKQGKKMLKVGKGNKLLLPSTLMSKNLLRPKDDVLVRVDGDRIIIKSFTNYQ